MKFDLGEILSSAIRITWKHRVLWLLSAMPVALGSLIYPVAFLPVLIMDDARFGSPFSDTDPIVVFLFIGFSIFISIASYALYGVSSAAVTLGVLRAESGEESFTVNGLLNDSRDYWKRMWIILLLVGVGVSLVFFVVFGCLALFGAVTAGVGFICAQPLILLLYPLMLFLYGFVEESQTSVVADNLEAVDAIRRGWELVRANFWRIVLLSLIVYFGMSLLSGLVMIPMMIPFFFLPFLMENGPSMEPRTILLGFGALSLLFLPVMALVQGIGITFLKSTYTLVYLRLTRSVEAVPAAPDSQSA